MPKGGKTRKQKILADLRRQAMHQDKKEVDLKTYSIPAQKLPHEESPIKIHSSTIDYRYLTRDLLRTLLLTCSIVIAELMMKYWFKF